MSNKNNQIESYFIIRQMLNLKTMQLEEVYWKVIGLRPVAPYIWLSEWRTTTN